VTLSSGDRFYVRASLEELLPVLGEGLTFVNVGGRAVSPGHVVQLTYGAIPSVEIPEALEALHGD
jgi:hypothetical protein